MGKVGTSGNRRKVSVAESGRVRGREVKKEPSEAGGVQLLWKPLGTCQNFSSLLSEQWEATGGF